MGSYVFHPKSGGLHENWAVWHISSKTERQKYKNIYVELVMGRGAWRIWCKKF